jgi:hypothetical protein
MLGADLVRQMGEYRDTIFSEWCHATGRRFLDDKARKTPEARASRNAAVQTIVREIGQRGCRGTIKAISNFFEELRLPDGRLFADVPHYEYNSLKRLFSGWVTFIEAVESRWRINDDNLSAREFAKSTALKEMAEAAGLVTRKAA